MVPLSFAGEEWLLTEGRALYWPRERALLVADLHLEKGSFFAGHGQMICLLYTSPSPRDRQKSRMPSSA